MENKIPSYLLQVGHEQHSLANRKRPKLSFLNKTLLNSASAIKSVYIQAENATKASFIHRINPYVKLFSLIYLEIVISLIHKPVAQILITTLIFLLYLISGLQVIQIFRKIFFVAFVFGFLVVLPAGINVISPGEIILNLFTFIKPSHFWIYNIPQRVGFTSEGILVISMVFLRVFNSVSFAMLIVFTTSFPAFIKSFKIVGVPDTFLMIISLAYKYIFILSRTIEESFFALKSRLISNINNGRIRKLVSGLIFHVFKKSMTIYENTYYAMVSRGYSGKVILHSQKPFTFRDFLTLFILLVLGIGITLV
jgi:energy-coupling factor transporter transmembrane protein EcfT